MHERIDDVRINNIEEVITPEELIKEVPASANIEKQVFWSRNTISRILHKKDDRLLVIIGPCSIHDPKAAIEYAEKELKGLVEGTYWARYWSGLLSRLKK